MNGSFVAGPQLPEPIASNCMIRLNQTFSMLTGGNNGLVRQLMIKIQTAHQAFASTLLEHPISWSLRSGDINVALLALEPDYLPSLMIDNPHWQLRDLGLRPSKAELPFALRTDHPIGHSSRTLAWESGVSHFFFILYIFLGWWNQKCPSLQFWNWNLDSTYSLETRRSCHGCGNVRRNDGSYEAVVVSDQDHEGIETFNFNLGTWRYYILCGVLSSWWAHYPWWAKEYCS